MTKVKVIERVGDRGCVAPLGNNIASVVLVDALAVLSNTQTAATDPMQMV